MAKIKSLYKCNGCGLEVPQWLGKCTDCGAWNSFQEVVTQSEFKSPQNSSAPPLKTEDRSRIVTLGKLSHQNDSFLVSGIGEFDRVMGGGIFEGSVTLLAGEPGIGKSTLLLQAAQALSKKGLVLYVSAEESLGQIQARAKRLKIAGDQLIVVAENNLIKIMSFLEEVKPALLILDSIQAVYHPGLEQGSGSLVQVRDSAMLLETKARELNIALVLVGHVTKDGTLAGPKTLEHLVDAVIYFEGDRYQNLRILRAIKNRNGTTGEIGLFEMSSMGLEEVKNASALFLEDTAASPGRVITPLLEGERPLLVEIQALVTPTVYPNPLRRSAGVDFSQLSLLVAVIEKTLKLNLSKSDLFLKVSGGLTVDEPACDLAVVLAIISSFLNQAVPQSYALIGEVGLGGEIRQVRSLDSRVRECVRLGIKNIILPKQKCKEPVSGVKLLNVSALSEAYQALMKGKSS